VVTVPTWTQNGYIFIPTGSHHTLIFKLGIASYPWKYPYVTRLFSICHVTHLLMMTYELVSEIVFSIF
jgi:hypothetical protein